MSILQRLEKLEAKKPKSKVVVKALFQKLGETRDACFKRYGYDPDKQDVMYILVTWAGADE
ncbi:MAG: hypothetical protein K8H84_06215 [Sulfuricella denitrificans]|nr:hypothetical protein [Sulfuricella denitrificans]